MFLTGFADEAGADLATQIRATKELGWKFIETRKIGNKTLATLTDAEFDDFCEKLDEAGHLIALNDFDKLDEALEIVKDMKFKKYKHNVNKIIKYLEDYIDNL